MSSQLLTTEETARRIGVKQTTVRTWLNKGLLEGTKVGGGKLWRVREEALEEFLKNNEAGLQKKKAL
jgi:excisionase family DNA binding protein